MPIALKSPRSYSNRSGRLAPCCPRCRADMLRIHRRRIDRVFSWFTPVQRYRCLGFSCQWEGNIQVPPVANTTSMGALGEADTTGLGDFGPPPPTRVSRFFVASMVAALAGVVFVVMGTYADWLSPTVAEDTLSSESTWRTSTVVVPTPQPARPAATK